MAQPMGGKFAVCTAIFSAGVGVLAVTQSSIRAVAGGAEYPLAIGTLARFVQPDPASATPYRAVSTTNLAPTSHGSNDERAAKFPSPQTSTIPIQSDQSSIHVPIPVRLGQRPIDRA